MRWIPPAALTALAVVRLVGAADATQIRFHYCGAELPNVVYHLACLTGEIPCTKAAFEKFWHESLHWTQEDQGQLDAWKEVVEANQEHAQFPPAPFLPQSSAFYPSQLARERLLGAALESRDQRQLERRVRGLAPPRDAARMAASLAYFERRFHHWWTATGARLVQNYLGHAEPLLRRDRMPEMAGQIARFVEADLETPDVFIYCIAQPAVHGVADAQGIASGEAGTRVNEESATVVGNHMVAETRDIDRPVDLEWKAMHELTHYLFSRAPKEKHIGMMQEFLKIGRFDGPGLYAFLNESLGTAVQLLIFERHGIPKVDFYRHPYIPRLALSTMPLLKRSLAGGPGLFHGFAADYIRAAEVELGDDAFDPKFMLASPAIFANPRDEDAVDAFVARFRPVQWIRLFADWEKLSDVNAIFFMNYEQARDAADFLKVPLEAGHRGFVYAVRHGTEAREIFLVGRDADANIELVKRLAELKPLIAGQQPAVHGVTPSSEAGKPLAHSRGSEINSEQREREGGTRVNGEGLLLEID